MLRYRIIIGFCVATFALLSTISLTGCNMVEGAGEAVSAMGRGISEDARAAESAIRDTDDSH